MKVLFLCAGVEHLGIGYLSAYLRAAGHQTALAFDPRLFDDKHNMGNRLLGRLFNRRRAVLAQVDAARPDLVAISTVRDLYPWALEMAAEVKVRLGVPVVMGGPHPTSMPALVARRPEVDFVVVGEGEQALLDLVNALESGDDPTAIPNLATARGDQVTVNPPRPLLADLDSLPLTDTALFAPHLPLDGPYTIMTGRGCPCACAYCSNSHWRRLYKGKGPLLRWRGADNIVAELEQRRAELGFSEVLFVDDIFTVDKERLFTLLELYRRRVALPFRCLSHPRYFDRDVAQALLDAGCLRVRLSTQSMNPEVRQQLFRRQDSAAQVRQAFRTCDEVGLPFVTDHILGAPPETEASYLDAARMYAASSQLSRVKCYYLDYFPGTDLVPLALERGYIDASDVEAMEQGQLPFYYADNRFVRTPARRRLARDFGALFKLLPLFPASLRPLLLRPEVYRHLHLLPGPVQLAAEVAVAVTRGDTALLPYLRSLLRNLKMAPYLLLLRGNDPDPQPKS